MLKFRFSKFSSFFFDFSIPFDVIRVPAIRLESHSDFLYPAVVHFEWQPDVGLTSHTTLRAGHGHDWIDGREVDGIHLIITP